MTNTFPSGTWKGRSILQSPRVFFRQIRLFQTNLIDIDRTVLVNVDPVAGAADDPFYQNFVVIVNATISWFKF